MTRKTALKIYKDKILAGPHIGFIEMLCREHVAISFESGSKKSPVVYIVNRKSPFHPGYHYRRIRPATVPRSQIGLSHHSNHLGLEPLDLKLRVVLSSSRGR